MTYHDTFTIRCFQRNGQMYFGFISSFILFVGRYSCLFGILSCGFASPVMMSNLMMKQVFLDTRVVDMLVQ